MEVRTDAGSIIKLSHRPDGSLSYPEHHCAPATRWPVGRQRRRQTQFHFHSVQKGGSVSKFLKAATSRSVKCWLFPASHKINALFVRQRLIQFSWTPPSLIDWLSNCESTRRHRVAVPSTESLMT